MYTLSDIHTTKQANDSLQKKNTAQLRVLSAVPVLQKMTGNVIQRNSFEDYDSYDEAKNANKYSMALLDKQKDDKIEKHAQKKFDIGQQSEIYKVNKASNGIGQITSDTDDITVLTKSNSQTLAHIDHRFPKSRGGSNHYTNAAVLAASANIKKSNTLEIDEEPDKALKPYRALGLDSAFEDEKVGAHREFTSEQRAAILHANKAHYGDLTSDGDEETKLDRLDTSRVPHIDHITAKGEGGTNYYFNAMVLPASENLQKSGAKGQDLDLDYKTGRMTLPQYYVAKAKGAIYGDAFEKN